jgi:hypothetical protein
VSFLHAWHSTLPQAKANYNFSSYSNTTPTSGFKIKITNIHHAITQEELLVRSPTLASHFSANPN